MLLRATRRNVEVLQLCRIIFYPTGTFSDAADDDAIFVFGKCAERFGLDVAGRRQGEIYSGHYAVIRCFADHDEVVLTVTI